MTKRKPKPAPEGSIDDLNSAAAVYKKPARTRAQIVNDQLDACKKSQLLEIARECVMRDGDWAASIMNAFETALAELDEQQKAEPAG